MLDHLVVVAWLLLDHKLGVFRDVPRDNEDGQCEQGVVCINSNFVQQREGMDKNRGSRNDAQCQDSCDLTS